MARDKPKIAFLISDTDGGGTETLEAALIKNIDRGKFRVIVVFTGTGSVAGRLKRYGDEYKDLRVGSYPSLQKIKNGKIREDFFAYFRLFGWLVRYVWNLSRWLRSEKIDLIHASGVTSNLVGGIAGRLVGIPSIWHIHALPLPQQELKRMGPLLVNGYLGRWLATRIVTVSHFTAKSCHKSWKKKTTVIWNAIDVKRIIENQHLGRLREIADVSENEKLVGILGQIEYRKGMDRFIEMSAKLAQGRDDVKFVIVGGDVAVKGVSQAVRADLVRSVEKLGISKKLYFTGHIDNAPYYIGDLDAFFMCSRPGAETFGLVVIEAMAARVPVVAFDNDAMGEIIEDGKTGFLVPEGDINLATERFSRILDDKSLADNIKKAALNHIRNNFDIDILINNIQKLYYDILQKT